jgi:glycosyltransferase involved in cell wall biosynthesis
MPSALESFDLRGYDLVISSESGPAKGVLPSANTKHVCYCHTPMRYAWDQRQHYLAEGALSRGVTGVLARHLLDRLQTWDRATSGRVNRFIANSSFVRERIARFYGRDADVIYPPVDCAFFTPGTDAPAERAYYVTASRFVPYKRIDIIVDAFRNLPGRHLVVVGDGPQAKRLRACAGDNVELVGEVSRERLRELLRAARAFVFAAEEDFGLLPVEAQACGTPVIAFGGGGALETVRAAPAARPTGLFFDAQTADAVASAIRRFEALPLRVQPADCRANAESFSTQRFRREFASFIDSAWNDFALGLR